MKKSSFLLGAAVAALTVGSAAAADLPVKARMAAPVVAPVFSWTGCYIGVHGGGGASRSDYVDDSSWGNGGLIGGQVGCNYQTGMLVMGAEGEAYWSGMKHRYDYTNLNNGEGNSQFAEVRNKYDLTLAGRIGVAYERAFIYGKLGWAWGAHDFSYGYNYPNNYSYSESGSATLNGPLFGVGLEYALTNNWTVKGEYNYINYGLGGVDFCGNYSYQTACNYRWSESWSSQKHIFKFGVNYLFGMGTGPVVAKY